MLVSLADAKESYDSEPWKLALSLQESNVFLVLMLFSDLKSSIEITESERETTEFNEPRRIMSDPARRLDLDERIASGRRGESCSAFSCSSRWDSARDPASLT